MHQKGTRGTIRLMLLSTFFLWLSVYTYPAFLSVYAQEELGATPVMVGTIIGSYGLTQLLLRLPMGIYSDIIRRRKPFMIIGMIAGTLAAFGFIAFKTPGAALFFRALSGVAASSWVLFSVMYSSQFSEGELTRAMGRLSTVQYAPQLMGMLVGGYLAEWIGKDAAFLLGAVAGLAGIVTTSMLKDSPPSGAPLTPRMLLSVGRNRRLLVSTGLSVLFHLIIWSTVLSFTANWAKYTIGMTDSQLGILSAMYLLPNVLLPRFTTGFLARKLTERGVVALGFVVAGVSCALFGHATNTWALYLVQLLFGVGMSMSLPFFLAGAVSGVEEEKRGAAMGFYQSLYSIGMFVGPVVAGGVVQMFSTGGVTHGYRANFYLMAALACVGALLAAKLWPRNSEKGR